LAIQPRSDSRARTRDVHPFAARRGLRLAHERRRSNGRSADLAGVAQRRDDRQVLTRLKSGAKIKRGWTLRGGDLYCRQV
jgi:hypothetical protein